MFRRVKWTALIQVVPLVAAPVIACFAYDRWWIIAAIFVFYIALAIVLDSWLIRCTLLGILLGRTLDPPVKCGTLETQVQESVSWLVFGVTVGILTGLAIEAFRVPNKRDGEDGN